jgi:hypothetical protein
VTRKYINKYKRLPKLLLKFDIFQMKTRAYLWESSYAFPVSAFAEP